MATLRSSATSPNAFPWPASDGAYYITGTTIDIDGGQLLPEARISA